MWKSLVLSLAAAGAMAFAPVHAADPTKADAVAMVEKTAAALKATSLDAVKAKIVAKDAEFNQGELYVALRRTDGTAIETDDPLQFASFPLVPFSNRIADGRFEWDGEQIEIDPNFAPEPHAIHGVGWPASVST